MKIKIPKNNGILIHGGGWKKLENISISKKNFKNTIIKNLGVKKVYDYYGMVEQTGSIFLECEKGYFHCSILTFIFVRDFFFISIFTEQKKHEYWGYTSTCTWNGT